MAQQKRIRRIEHDALTILRNDLRRFVMARDWKQFHTPKNLSMGLMIESGELAEHFLWAQTGDNLSNKKLIEVADEIGDVFIYLLNLVDSLGIDLIRVTQRKLKKNRKKYPVRLVRGMALKYNDYHVRSRQ